MDVKSLMEPKKSPPSVCLTKGGNLHGKSEALIPVKSAGNQGQRHRLEEPHESHL